MSEPSNCVETLRVLGHELRRPLTVIRGAATLLVDDEDRLPPASRQQMLAMIDRSAGTMAELIDDLLTAVHLESGTLRLEIVPAALSSVVAEAVELARVMVPDRTIEVGGVDGFEVEADREQAVRVVRSLLMNAARFSPADSPVDVAATSDSATVTVRVMDRGPGIPAASRERAFQKFVRLDRQTEGAGLGLFLARGLARAMGGDVTLADREDGGALACFTLRRRA